MTSARKPGDDEPRDDWEPPIHVAKRLLLAPPPFTARFPPVG